MDNYPLISVIIPVYNTGKFLCKCVDSVIHQSYQNLEIILVDDGSTDDGPSICNEYINFDTRIAVIHKKNGGVSSARNTGIDKAHGEYLCFIDSDDYIDQYMLEKLYHTASEHNADITFCNYNDVYDAEYLGRKYESMEIKRGVISSVEAIGQLDLVPFIVVWNKLYKKRVFKNIRYPEGYFYEDEIVIHRLYGECEKIAVIPDRLYFYRHHNGSITDTTEKNIRKLDTIKALCDRAVYCHMKGWSELENIAAARLWNFWLEKYFLFDQEDIGNRAILKRSLNDFRKAVPCILRSNKVSKKAKAVVLTINISPKLHFQLLKVYHWIFYVKRDVLDKKNRIY